MTRLIMQFPRVRAEYLLANTALCLQWQQLIADPAVDLQDIRHWQIMDPAYIDLAQARLTALTGHSQWTADSLNEWHWRFEQTRSCYDPRWHEINTLIHCVQQSRLGRDRVRIGYFHYDPKAVALPEITDQLWPYFQYDCQPGDLLLGYHTIGKDLWAAYVDQDRRLVEDSAVNTQTRIGPEFIMILNQHTDSYRARVMRVQAWLEYLGKNMGPSDSWLLNRPLLGRLITDLSELKSKIGLDKPEKVWLEH